MQQFKGLTDLYRACTINEMGEKILLLFLNDYFQRVQGSRGWRNRQMIISLSAKGQFGLFHCTAPWNSTELMRLSDTPRTMENSAGSNSDFQVACRVTPVIRLQQSCFLQNNPHRSCCWNISIFYIQP